MNLTGRAQKLRQALARPAATELMRSNLGGSAFLLRLYRTHRDGIVFLGSHHCDLSARLLVERGQSGLVAGFESVHFVAYDQGILRPLGHTGPRASGIIASHGVLGAAHRVADRPRESFTACSKSRGSQSCG